MLRRAGQGSQAYTRRDRLRYRWEYCSVQTHGRRVHTPHFVIIVQRSPSGRQRLGVTVTKKIGRAVQRNRVKRVVREVFRQNRSWLPGEVDLLFIAKQGAPDLDYATVLREVEKVRHVLARAARGPKSKGIVGLR